MHFCVNYSYQTSPLARVKVVFAKNCNQNTRNAMAKVKAGISKLGTEELISRGQTMYTMMVDNPVFASLAALLVLFKTALENLVNANNDARNIGGRVAHEHKRAAELIVRTMINDMAPQVQTLTGGDPVKIVDGGWELVKKPEHGERPATPGNFRSILTAYAGSIKLHWTGNKLALFYQLEQQDADGNWNVVALTSRNRFNVTGLTSGKEYSFRVLAMGSVGASAYTDELTARAA